MRLADQPGWAEYGDWANGKPLMAGPWLLGQYQPSPETAEYWCGIERGELLLKSCRDCRRLHHPRRIVCSDCTSDNLDWKRAAGTGRIYSFSEIHRAVSPVAGPVPFFVGLVRLDEGVALLTRLEGAITIDAPVSVAFKQLEAGFTLPVFVTIEGGARS